MSVGNKFNHLKLSYLDSQIINLDIILNYYHFLSGLLDERY
jgi:hypothetical protein